jgi:ADP-heptose:LPS heptosyltransferase
MLIPSVLRIFRGGAKGDKVTDSPQRILLIKQSERLGNIILMNAGIAGLRRAFPSARIDLLLPAAYAEVMRANNDIDEIIAVKKREYIVKPWKLLSLFSEVRRRQYELAINCSDVNSHSSTEAAYAILSGAKLTAGWKAGRGGIFDIEIESYADTIHATQMYVRLFSQILGRQIEGDPYFPQEDSIDPAGQIIGLNCGGRGAKRIPIDLFLKLGEKLSQSGAKVQFILGPDESGMRSGFEARLPKGCILLPPVELKSLMRIIKGYVAFVSSDTGPMHLAWMLRVPTVAIFIDSEIDKFRPLSNDSLAIDGRNGIDLDCIFNHLIKIVELARVKQ